MRQVGYADATPPQADAAFLRRMWDLARGEAVTLR
jgi:hypothetical protein